MNTKRVSLLLLPFVVFTTVSAVFRPLGFVSSGGTAGKFYWADNETRNWEESTAFCKENGYLLATSLAKPAVDMLKTKYDPVTFTGTHWIAAKSGPLPGSMAWDSGTAVAPIVGIEWREPDTPLCGAFYSGGDGDASYFRALSGSLRYKTLCEEIYT